MTDHVIKERNRKNRERSKSQERRIAKLFGTERTPGSGITSKHTSSDTLHEFLYIEIKSRKRMWAHGLFREIKRKAKKEEKDPLLVTMETDKKLTLITYELKTYLEREEYIKQLELRLLSRKWM